MPLPLTSRYEKSFYHNNRRCRIVWGYDATIVEIYIKREDNDKVVFNITTEETIVPHPHFPHITGRWRLEELHDVFSALSEHIPAEHIEAVRVGRPF
jgi:hypothetical protein